MKGAESSEWYVGTAPRPRLLQLSFGLSHTHQADSLQCLAGSKHGTLNGKTLWWRGDHSPVTYQLYNRIHSELDKQKTDDRKGAGGGEELKMIKFPLEMSFLKVMQIALRRVLELHINGNVNTPNTPSHACKLASPLKSPMMLP